MQNQSLDALDTLAEELTLRREVSEFGMIQYLNCNDELHRVNGPALIYANGTKYWFQNGKMHRLGGPAVTHVNGTRLWYQNNECHRLDGPAAIYPNGDRSWFINGIRYSEEDFNTHLLVVAHKSKDVL